MNKRPRPKHIPPVGIVFVIQKTYDLLIPLNKPTIQLIVFSLGHSQFSSYCQIVSLPTFRWANSLLLTQVRMLHIIYFVPIILLTSVPENCKQLGLFH